MQNACALGVDALISVSLCLQSSAFPVLRAAFSVCFSLSVAFLSVCLAFQNKACAYTAGGRICVRNDSLRAVRGEEAVRQHQPHRGGEAGQHGQSPPGVGKMGQPVRHQALTSDHR